HRLRKMGKAERQVVRICESENRSATGLGERDGIVEPWIAESRVVIEGIVDRMVDAVVFTLAAKADIHRGNAEMLQERRVVGTRAECINPQISALACLTASFGIAVQNDSCSSPVGNRDFLFGVDNVTRHVVYKFL